MESAVAANQPYSTCAHDRWSARRGSDPPHVFRGKPHCYRGKQTFWKTSFDSISRQSRAAFTWRGSKRKWLFFFLLCSPLIFSLVIISPKTSVKFIHSDKSLGCFFKIHSLCCIRLHPLALLILQSKGGKIIIVSHKTKQYRGSAPHCLCIAVKVKDCNICDGIFSLQLYLFIYWSALLRSWLCKNFHCKYKICWTGGRTCWILLLTWLTGYGIVLGAGCAVQVSF